MKWKVFLGASIVCLIGVVMLMFSGGEGIAGGIALSIIAAYIFYIPIELVPAILRDIEKRPAEVVAYRKLQLLLAKLDDFFIEIYKEAKGDKTLTPETSMSVDEFYDPDFMMSFLPGFDMLQISNTETPDGRAMSYYEKGCAEWREITSFSQSLLQMSVVQEDMDFLFEVSYLSTENRLHIIFDWAQFLDLSRTQCAAYLGLNQMGGNSQIRTFENIINLHKVANRYYKKFEKKVKYKGLVFEPRFYSKDK